MTRFNGSISYTVRINVEGAEADDRDLLKSDIYDNLQAAVENADLGEGIESVDVEMTSDALKVARKTFEVSVTITRTQRVETTLLVAADDEDEAQRWAERDYDAEYDTDWSDADSEDTELEVSDVAEYSDDEDDADHQA